MNSIYPSAPGAADRSSTQSHFYRKENLHKEGVESTDTQQKMMVVVLKGIRYSPLLQVGATAIQFHHIMALTKMYYKRCGKGLFYKTPQQQKECFQRAFALLENAEESSIRKIITLFDQSVVESYNLFQLIHDSSNLFCGHRTKEVKEEVERFFSGNDLERAEQLYLIGHSLALDEAINAAQGAKNATLSHAYAVDAFACHFLTELFTPGHFCSQQPKLEQSLLHLRYSAAEAKGYALFLTATQRIRAEKLLIRDSYCQAEKNSVSIKMVDQRVKKAIQLSLDELYTAFCNPLLPIQPCSAHVKARDRSQLYVVEERLFIYRGNEKIGISNQLEFENIAIPYALRALLEHYQYDYHLLNCCLFYIREKFPLILPEKTQLALTQSIRIYRESREFMKARFHHSPQKLYRFVRAVVEKAKSTLREWPVGSVKDIALMQSIEQLGERHTIEEMEDRVFDLAVCLEKTLKEGITAHTIEKNRLNFTRWFRRMLDYQEIAYKLYLAENRYNLEKGEIDRNISLFVDSIECQIQKHREYLVQDIVYTPTSTSTQREREAEELDSFMRALNSFSEASLYEV